jgi:hypothetical protein
MHVRPPQFRTVFAAALAAAAACAAATAPNAADAITGTVTARAPGADDLVPLAGARRATGTSAGSAGRLLLRVGGAAVYVRERDGALRRATPAAAVAGATVRAWPTGAELRSDPPQYPVTRVEITPPAP